MVTDVNACACDIGREKEAVIAIVPENYSFFAAVQIVPILYPLLLCIGVLSFILYVLRTTLQSTDNKT